MGHENPHGNVKKKKKINQSQVPEPLSAQGRESSRGSSGIQKQLVRSILGTQKEEEADSSTQKPSTSPLLPEKKGRGHNQLVLSSAIKGEEKIQTAKSTSARGKGGKAS